MKEFLYQNQWSWKTGGIILGLVFLLAVALVKPIGVSTQFVIFDGIVWDIFDNTLVSESTQSKSGFASTNAYLNKSGGKYASSIAKPLGYGFIFVIAMILGGFIARKFQTNQAKTEQQNLPAIWCEKFGNDSQIKRYIFAFVGGILVLYGARLAGGCTSGHMMSGIMQTSISGYVFAIGAFAIAIPASMLIFKGVKS